MIPLKPFYEWRNTLLHMNRMHLFDQREDYIRQCGFPILPLETVDTLAGILKGRKVVEVGCGTGYLAFHLRERGIHVTAVDSYAEQYTVGGDDQTMVTLQAEGRGVVVDDALQYVPGDYDVVIMSWPDYKSTFASDIAQRMKPGQMLIYQGENQYGCTADNLFFELLDSSFKELPGFTKALAEHHLRFDIVHDTWQVFCKLPNGG